MGWAVGYDSNWRRDIGYGVPALCDQPDCVEEIDSGSRRRHRGSEDVIEHRPDIKGATPLETWHITETCRSNRGVYLAWEDAVRQLRVLYEAQTLVRPGDTFSLALFRSSPSDTEGAP